MDTAPSAPARRRRGPELLSAIRSAALAEVAATGLSGLTMDGIATRAKTSRTSLYRRWDSTEDLLLDAFGAALTPPVPPAGSGDVRADLIALLEQMALHAVRSPLAAAISAVIGERARHPRLTDAVHSLLVQPGIDAVAAVLSRGAGTGDVAPEAITPEVCAAGPALMAGHSLIHGAPPDHEGVARIVDRVVLPALRP